MEPTAVILGIGLISFLLLYLSFNLDNQHAILKILTIFMAFMFLFLIPKAIIDYPTNCEIVVDNQNITDTKISDTVITHEINNTYTTYCGEEKNTGALLLKNHSRMYLLLIIYAFIYLFYYSMQLIRKAIKQ